MLSRVHQRDLHRVPLVHLEDGTGDRRLTGSQSVADLAIAQILGIHGDAVGLPLGGVTLVLRDRTG